MNLGNKKLKERYDNIPSFLIDNKIIVIDDYDEKNQSFNWYKLIYNKTITINIL